MGAPKSPDLRPLTPDDDATRRDVLALIDRVRAQGGEPPLSDASRLALSGRGGEFHGLVQRRDGAVVAYTHLDRRDDAWTIEVVTDPGVSPAEAVPPLLRAAASLAEAGGATEIRYWDLHHQADLPELAGLGFGVERDLLQMRVPLPLTVAPRPVPDGFTLRPFRPGVDEVVWLAVNNAAFASHPEQGRWELADLVAREGEPWFDPQGFVLCEHDGRLAASCWTKVHADHRPPLGEIYVISVNPAFQGRGLGRVLTVAGLEWLAQRVATGMLYVDAANEAAVSLYRSLGFTVDHVDRCYLRRLD